MCDAFSAPTAVPVPVSTIALFAAPLLTGRSICSVLAGGPGAEALDGAWEDRDGVQQPQSVVCDAGMTWQGRAVACECAASGCK